MRRSEWTNTPYHGEGRGATLFNLPYDTSGRSLFAVFPQKSAEETDAELDARAPFPFMVKFTKKVISTLEAAQDEAHSKRMNFKSSERMFWELDYRMHELHRLRTFYEERLAFYRGIRDNLPKRIEAFAL